MELNFEERFALGAAIIPLNSFSILIAILFDGILQAKVSSPLDARFDILLFYLFFNIMVKGPVQNLSAKIFAFFVNITCFFTSFMFLK